MTTERTYENDYKKADATGLPTREIRALEEEMSVIGPELNIELEADEYEVVSQSGRTYYVDARRATCTCPDHQQRDEICKHQRRVQLEAGMRYIPMAALEVEVSDQLNGEHVAGSPKMSPAAVAADGSGVLETPDDDGDEFGECEHLPAPGCWECYKARNGVESR